MLKNPFRGLSGREWGLWLVSLTVVILSNLMTGTVDAITLTATLVGVTALIFVARGDVWGQLLTVIFSLLYSVTSWRFHYYGEIITYLGMSAPIAAASAITWMKHPYKKRGKRGKDRPSVPTPCASAVTSHRRRDRRLLFHPEDARHRQSRRKHAFRRHQLSRFVSHVASQLVLRRGIRGKRHRPHRSVDTGVAEGYYLSPHGRQFSGLFGQRYLRLLELEPKREKASKIINPRQHRPSPPCLRDSGSVPAKQFPRTRRAKIGTKSTRHGKTPPFRKRRKGSPWVRPRRR